MTTVVFRKEAEADLRSIIVYYEEVAPDALPNILSDIYRSIDQLARYPHSGMAVPRHLPLSGPRSLTFPFLVESSCLAR